MSHEQLGEVLVRQGALTVKEAAQAIHDARRGKRLLGDQLLVTGQVSEVELYRALAEQHGIPVGRVEPLMEELDRSLVAKVPRPFLERSNLLPIRMVKGRVTIATSDPDAPYRDLSLALQADSSELRLVTPTDLRRMWSILDLESTSVASVATLTDDDLLADPTVESRMVSLFEAILLDAIGSRTSDIHLERYVDTVRLRYRVDGHLHDVHRFKISPADLRGVVNVVKIAAEMDITERRLPQGGRLRRRAGDDVYDLRVQTQPSLHGEHVIIRLLRQDKALPDVEDLGFRPDLAERYRRLLRSPQGLVLVVGPTGSGKSTTLYTGLKLLADDTSRKVITVEDPIEYAIAGIQQTQVHSEIGFGFANAMRAFVREDPDIILVGEIRDGETALEAIRASQTGHLVLSTLHCNDTVDAVQRLFDLGMHPNSIASELIAVISQRLVRRVCQYCSERVDADPEILGELFPDNVPRVFPNHAGSGCERCDGRGTRGRIGAFEFLRVDEDIRRAIARQLTVDDLRGLAYQAGLKPLRNHLIELVLTGVTPLSEVRRTLSIEQMAPKNLELDEPLREAQKSRSTPRDS